MKIEFLINGRGELYGFKTSDEEEEVEELRIPSIVNGVKVTSILKKFRESSIMLYLNGVRKINRLLIEDGIEEIQACAFSLIDIKITTVHWPRTCLTIPFRCFSGSNIETIVGIENVKEIEPYAFKDTLLKKISWPSRCKTVPDSCFYRCHNLEQIDGLEVIINIGEDAFQRSGIKTFLCPASVSVAEASAFLEGCDNLEEIRFEGTGIKDVDLEYFFSLKNIKKIDLSGCSAVNLINCSSEEGCKVRDKVVLPYYATEIN